MDIIEQTKLTKEEWESIEKPCNQNDKFILEFLNRSYDNVDEILYKNLPILNHLKITDQMHQLLLQVVYDSYFRQKIIAVTARGIFNKVAYARLCELKRAVRPNVPSMKLFFSGFQH